MQPHTDKETQIHRDTRDTDRDIYIDTRHRQRHRHRHRHRHRNTHVQTHIHTHTHTHMLDAHTHIHTCTYTPRTNKHTCTYSRVRALSRSLSRCASLSLSLFLSFSPSLSLSFSLSLFLSFSLSLLFSLFLFLSFYLSLFFSFSLSLFHSLSLSLCACQSYRQVGLEIVDQAALDVSNEAVVHVLHFKTFTECNPPHTLSPSTAADARKWGVSYDLSVTQLIEAMCCPSVWKKSLIINLTLLEGHANAGRFVRCPFCSFATCGSCVCVPVYFPCRVCCLTHFLLMMHTAGQCEGHASTTIDIDAMQAASAPWIRKLIATIISTNIALAANQGGRKRDVAVSVTKACLCFLSGACLMIPHSCFVLLSTKHHLVNCHPTMC